ncbi:MAG TPA: NAD(P)H-dependent glycerol-3-phosphate dehydrogenase [Acidobacteriota bacterium]|nr:NAD(P)H-dependent glycerol-3-phosphate dehydrogenase [Acidobacteriota bacterium]
MTRRTDKRIVVWGGGSWGTALAVHLARRADRVALWVYDQGQYETMASARGNPDFLPGVALPENMDLFHRPPELPYQGDLWLSITPTQYLRNLWKEIAPRLEKTTIVVSASKGIENGTLLLPSEIIESFTGAGDVVALSGPSFARDFVNGDPTAVVFASPGAENARKAQELFSFDNLRGYYSADRKGVELGGAVKNVIAIASGLATGLGFGPNAVAAIITRGVREISRLGATMGCQPETFAGLSGLGDLVLTCYGTESRNRSLGVRLGKGEKLQDILDSMRMVAEGVPTTLSIHKLRESLGIEMPISMAVHGIIYESVPPRKALEALLARSLKRENE